MKAQNKVEVLVELAEVDPGGTADHGRTRSVGGLIQDALDTWKPPARGPGVCPRCGQVYPGVVYEAQFAKDDAVGGREGI